SCRSVSAFRGSLFVWWNRGDVASFVFLRNADGRPRIWRLIQRARDCAVNNGWLRRMGQYSSFAPATVATAVQMGDLLFRRRRVLESGRCRHFWIHDKSADRALLHARTQYYCSLRPRRAVRCLRHARIGVDALLFASDEAGVAVE